MIVRTILYSLIVLICSASVTSAGGIRPGLRLLGGYGSLAMNDLNNSLDRWNENLLEAGVAGQVSTHGAGAVWGVDLCVDIHRRVLAVVSYDRTPSHLDDRLDIGSGFFTVNRDLDGKFISVGVIVYPMASLPAYLMVKGGRCSRKICAG